MGITFFSFHTFLVFFMLIASLIVVFSRNMYIAVLGLSLFSMFLAVKYFLLQAPDVAITEAALGTGLATLVYLIAIKKTTSGK